MTTVPNPYRGFRFPAGVIEHAVWPNHCFSLSLRDVETILAARGIVVSYESIRDWGLRFGRLFANALKRRRRRPGDKWFMDEVLIPSANSGSPCQGCKARHARLGAWPCPEEFQLEDWLAQDRVAESDLRTLLDGVLHRHLRRLGLEFDKPLPCPSQQPPLYAPTPLRLLPPTPGRSR